MQAFVAQNVLSTNSQILAHILPLADLNVELKNLCISSSVK